LPGFTWVNWTGVVRILLVDIVYVTNTRVYPKVSGLSL
jgi:hypothetical protein